MRPAELREMTDEELGARLERAAEDLFRLKFRQHMAQSQSTAEIRKARRDVARIRTAIRERQIGISKAPTARSLSGEAGQDAQNEE